MTSPGLILFCVAAVAITAQHSVSSASIGCTGQKHGAIANGNTNTVTGQIKIPIGIEISHGATGSHSSGQQAPTGGAGHGKATATAAASSTSSSGSGNGAAHGKAAAVSVAAGSDNSKKATSGHANASASSASNGAGHNSKEAKTTTTTTTTTTTSSAGQKSGSSGNGNAGGNGNGNKHCKRSTIAASTATASASTNVGHGHSSGSCPAGAAHGKSTTTTTTTTTTATGTGNAHANGAGNGNVAKGSATSSATASAHANAGSFVPAVAKSGAIASASSGVNNFGKSTIGGVNLVNQIKPVHVGIPAVASVVNNHASVAPHGVFNQAPVLGSAGNNNHNIFNSILSSVAQNAATHAFPASHVQTVTPVNHLSAGSSAGASAVSGHGAQVLNAKVPANGAVTITVKPTVQTNHAAQTGSNAGCDCGCGNAFQHQLWTKVAESKIFDDLFNDLGFLQSVLLNIPVNVPQSQKLAEEEGLNLIITEGPKLIDGPSGSAHKPDDILFNINIKGEYDSETNQFAGMSGETDFFVPAEWFKGDHKLGNLNAHKAC